MNSENTLSATTECNFGQGHKDIFLPNWFWFFLVFLLGCKDQDCRQEGRRCLGLLLGMLESRWSNAGPGVQKKKISRNLSRHSIRMNGQDRKDFLFTSCQKKKSSLELRHILRPDGGVGTLWQYLGEEKLVIYIRHNWNFNALSWLLLAPQEGGCRVMIKC